jgi:hypothetical protein
MKLLTRFSGCCLSAALILSATERLNAAVVSVDPSVTWLGYMNVSDLPANGGTFQFGSTWGTTDLSANFSGNTLTLAPNTINDPATYWYVGGGAPGAAGNKNMEANFYQEFTGPYAGQTLTFTGVVLANSLTTAHTAIAFIKDFAPDYSSSVSSTVALTPGQFSVSLPIINDPNRHVQFGFQMTGVNVWATDVAPFGSVQITSVPEPSTFAFAFIGLAGLMVRNRFKF